MVGDLARGDEPVDRTGLRQRIFGRHMGECPHLGVQLGCARKVVAGQFDSGQIPRPDGTALLQS